MEGVAHASKVVFFIDEAWCTSYNCLQELAFAIHYSKPLVVLVLDQQAWEMLTIPGGAASAWENDCWGPCLMSYEGEEISPGMTFDAATVHRLYSQVSSINLCPCRELDEANWGLAGVLDNALKYVTKDLEYHKEHAELACFVVRWEDGQKRPSLLLNDSETIRWERWVDAAQAAEMQPAPTDKQKEFIRECRRWKKTRHRRIRVAVIAALLCIIAGAIASVVMAVRYNEERAVAIQQEELATQQMLKAQRVSAASMARSLLTQIGLSTSPNEMPVREAQWHLTAAKLVAQANDTGLYSWARDMLRHTLSKPWANVASLDMDHMAVALTRTTLSWSADGSWLASYTMAGEALAWNIGSGSIQPVLLAYNASGANETAEGFRADGDVAWSPDGLQLAVSYPKGRVAIWDLGIPGDHQLTKLFEPPHVSWRDKAIASVIGDSPLFDETEPGGYDKTALEKIAKAIGAESLDTAAEFLDVSLDMQKPGLSALAWSSKGGFLASSSPSSTNVVVWNAGSSNSEDPPFVQFEPGDNVVNALAWSPDGEILAVGGHQSDNGCIHIGLWIISSAGEVFNAGEYAPWGECSRKEDNVVDLSWLRGGNSLVALSQSGLQTTLDFMTGEVRVSADRKAIGISASSAGVAVALESGGISVSSRDGREVSAFMEGDTFDGGIAFSPDSSLLACSNAAGPVLVWRHSLLSDNRFRRLLLPSVPVDHLKMSPNTKLWSGYKQTASADAAEDDGASLLHVWNLEGVFNAQEGVWGPWMRRITLKGADCCLYDWSPDGTAIAAPRIIQNDITTPTELGVWRVTQSTGLSNTTTSTEDRTSDGFSAELSSSESVLSSGSPYARFHALKWSPDGSMIAAVSTTGGIMVWNVSSGQSQSLSFAEGSEPVLLNFPMWSSDSRYLSAGAYQGGDIHIWDLSKNNVGHVTESTTLPSAVPRYPVVHWSPSNPRTFAVMLMNQDTQNNRHKRQSQIELWEFPSEGTLPELWGSLPGSAVAISWRPGTQGNSSKQLATLGGYNATSLRIWDVGSAEAVLLDGPTDTGLGTDSAGHYDISWSPTGHSIAVSSDPDDVAKIYDVESARLHAIVCPVSLGWLHWEGEYAWACSRLIQSNNTVSVELHVNLTVSYGELQDSLSGMIPIPLQDANLEEAEKRLPSATLTDPAMCHAT